MTNHVTTMLALRDCLSDLHHAQDVIDLGRALSGNNQEMQLHMDRSQALVNDKRTRVEETMLAIAKLN